MPETLQVFQQIPTVSPGTVHIPYTSKSTKKLLSRYSLIVNISLLLGPIVAHLVLM